MPSRKIVHTRKAGWCDHEFAHPGRIEYGDRIEVTTYFPSDEEVREFGVQEFRRTRRCSWCLTRDEARAAELADYATRTDPHDPCCTSHGVTMTCAEYRRTHFVETGPCCPTEPQEQKP